MLVSLEFNVLNQQQLLSICSVYYAGIQRWGKMLLKVMIVPIMSVHCAPDPVLVATNTVVIITVKVNFVIELSLVREKQQCAKCSNGDGSELCHQSGSH